MLTLRLSLSLRVLSPLVDRGRHAAASAAAPAAGPCAGPRTATAHGGHPDCRSRGQRPRPAAPATAAAPPLAAALDGRIQDVKATSSSSTATCWCSRKSCCSRPTPRSRCSSRWTSARCSSSTRCRSSSTTRWSPTTCTRRSKSQALHRGGVQRVYLGNLKAGDARTGRVLHRQGPARPRLQARRDRQVRQGHRAPSTSSCGSRTPPASCSPSSTSRSGSNVRMRVVTVEPPTDRGSRAALALWPAPARARGRTPPKPPRGPGSALRRHPVLFLPGPLLHGHHGLMASQHSAACRSTPTRPRCCAAACSCRTACTRKPAKIFAQLIERGAAP